MREEDPGHVYTGGEAICSEGGRNEAMHIAQSGEMKIFKHTNTEEFKLIRGLMYILVSLTLALTSCGGGGPPPGTSGAAGISEINGRTPVLRIISVTPSNLLGIDAGTRLHFAATASYSDNSVQDITALTVWFSSDTSVASISNAPGSKGQAIAVSSGYCSITATLGNISGSTAIGVK